MPKKIKYGTVDFGPDEFKEENITAQISLRIPLKMMKDLRKFSLNKRFQGRYKDLIRDILTTYIADKKLESKKRRKHQLGSTE